MQLSNEVMEAIIYAGFSVFGYQSVLSRAKQVNARAETREEIDTKNREIKSNFKYTRRRVDKIESILWKALDKYREEMNKNGITKTQIHRGNDLLSNKLVSDVKRDYHQAMGKESVALVEGIITDINDDLNTYIDKWGCLDKPARDKLIDTITGDNRSSFLDNIHKRDGYNSDVEEMENTALPLPMFREIIEDILTHAEKKRILRENEERDILKQYRVSAFSPIKILKAVVSSRKGSRR